MIIKNKWELLVEKKMKKEFSRENVVNKYIEAINKTMEDKK